MLGRIQSINQSPISKVRKILQKIQGRQGGPKIHHLKINELVTDVQDIADSLAKDFADKSSSDNYSQNFQNHKMKAENLKLHFSLNNKEDYNQLFSVAQLDSAISKSHDPSPGPDDIHYQLIKHLSAESLHNLLELFNNISETGFFPPSWPKATVVPIPKPEKEPSDPSNYRPIELTSCLCKITEQMINSRLVWYLESNNLLTAFQSGFRRGRSTLV